MTWYDLLLLPENLLWAWRKVRRAYAMADSLYDPAELAAFELSLEAELSAIRADFEAGRWVTSPLRLVPQPKKPDKDGNPRFRQYFQLSVRDQVAWVAVANVLGPELDRKMPAWSYGNRLYRAAWYETEPAEGRSSRLNIGPYRHSAGHLYRHFKHSWPLYRRHISLTARKMVVEDVDPEELDLGERLALDQSEDLPYFVRGHWVRPTKQDENIFAASLDLRKFYPSVRTAAIAGGFEAFVEDYREDPRLPLLIEQMLVFTIASTGVSEGIRRAVDPPVEPGAFDGIPTGLFAGGFLANVAMLPLDLDVDRILRQRRDIAHFRFVDDHEILAYDFATIVDWIRDYAKLLEQHGIGATIEDDKFVPTELKWILKAELPDRPPQSDAELWSTAASAAAVNGRKPVQLMTRTLAQVSMLAAIDFDLLTDAGRGQRLEQLEWLLLANIPEHEIRSDTRMAFAAARIANLTPALFRPNDKLLEAHRQLSVMNTSKGDDEAHLAAILALKARITELETEEAKSWSALRKRHFGLLFEAFATHPDKVRLYIRLFDYCRITGHDGFPRLSEWMAQHSAIEFKALRCYLGALALQVLSRHVLTASAALTRTDILTRDRQSARAFLLNVVKANLDPFAPISACADALEDFQSAAMKAFVMALLLGSIEVETDDPAVAGAMAKRAAGSMLNLRREELASVKQATGISLGVWYHWFFVTSGAHREAMPAYWPEVAKGHRPADPADWNSLRRYPIALPEAAWDRLSSTPKLLGPDDAGWLLDAARANEEGFAKIAGGDPPYDEVRTRVGEITADLSLREWVLFTNTLPPNDPRRSEWTALEIIRQVLRPLFEFEGLDLEGRDPDYLDTLHPESVRVHSSWRDLPQESPVTSKVTWEGWRHLAREHRVQVADSGLEDYRYREILPAEDRQWPRRLRPIGQLLWGMLRRSFKLPSAWNIRGQERSFMEVVAWDIERLPISSFTLAILQSCLLPRSRETSLLNQFPLLFGNARREAAIDTEFDRPIHSPSQLDALLERAQRILQLSQMTVLEHEPRQLIPVRLRQIAAFDDGGADDTEAQT
jgi:hypothetical protein